MGLESEKSINPTELKAENILKSIEGLILEASSNKAAIEYEDVDSETPKEELSSLRISLIGSIAEQIDEYISQLKTLHPESWKDEIDNLLNLHSQKIVPEVQQMLIESVNSYQ